jgi:CheY-like chemotaxis protein
MNLHAHCVLIVEDEFLIAGDLTDIFREAGAEVVGPATSVPTAFRLLDAKTVTAAILDVRLGDHDSLPIARRLADAGIPFVFHTGLSDNRALSTKWPQIPVLRKPATSQALIAAVEVVANAVRFNSAAALDPPGYTSPYAESLETLNFPLLPMLRAAPGWRQDLTADPQLLNLAADRRSRVLATMGSFATAHCAAAAWAWTKDDIAVVETALRRIVDQPGRAKALVAALMRPSGRFARHSALSDADLVAAAWADTAAGLNNILAVYAEGHPPRYPLIDAAMFDVKDKLFAGVIDAHGQMTIATALSTDLLFDAGARFVIGLLRLNERDEAANYRPLLSGANIETVLTAKRICWADHRYPALLVFGMGPEDTQSRTGALGYVRMAMAADLFKRKLAPFIIVSGGNVHPDRTPFNEAVEMKRILIEQHDIPATRILIEPHARHATTNLRNCGRMLFAAGFPTDRPSLIVSDPMTAPYIGSPDLIARTITETGISPGYISPSDIPFSLEFIPDCAVFHVDPTDPLDP